MKQCMICGELMICLGEGWVCITDGCPNCDKVIKKEENNG